MGIYPNMMQPIPFMKHKSKHPAGVTQEKINNPNEKNEEIEQKIEDKNNEDIQNQMQEEPKQDIWK